MNIIIPTDDEGNMTSLDKLHNAVFLAGPYPREDYEKNDVWRKEAYSIFEDIGFDGDILNPTNKNYGLMKDLTKQTDWENEAMHKASAIIFYLERTEKNPGFTSNIEIGMWLKSNNIFVCIPDDSRKKNANAYIRIKCDQAGIPVFNTLEETIIAVDEKLNKDESKKWFISDTHFSQQRTLDFSKRPFRNVKEMDLEIISNWNKSVTVNDSVYLLGDIGEDSRYFNCLNFKELNIIKGNYERDKIPSLIEDLRKIKNIKIYENDEVKLSFGGYNFILRHEPITNKKLPKDTICLYGHIHEKAKIKKNGINVGADVNNFCPFSEEDIIFYANAIKNNYYDENVFTEECK
jgi:calcineurin-like phosphoesterase family protein